MQVNEFQFTTKIKNKFKKKKKKNSEHKDCW